MRTRYGTTSNSGMKKPVQKQAKTKPSPAKPDPAKTSTRLRLIIALALAAIAFLFYANTLQHDYALDDFSLIKENAQTKKGTAALKQIFTSSYRSGYYLPDNDLYRPLSKAMFAIEWQLAPDKPALGHWVNVLLYAFTAWLLFYTLLLYFPHPDKLWFCALTTLLFVAHPIHTEVVANIKSRDEILSFLFFLFMAMSAISYAKQGRISGLLFAAISFFISLLSKESGITFLAAIPLMIYFFTDASVKKQIILASTLLLTGLIFFIIRTKILGAPPGLNPSIMDNLLVGAHNKLLQTTSAISILGIYLKLLFFPHPLVSDYSFNQIPLAGLTDWHFLLSFLIYASLAAYAILKLKEKNLIAFGILFFFITISITSNIVMLIGTSFGERLLYAPALGFCIIIAYLLTKYFKPEDKRLWAITTILVLLFFTKTYSRNQAWVNNVTLHSTDVLNSPNSARAHYYYGNIITQNEYLDTIKDQKRKNAVLETALHELRRTIEIYPAYADAYHKIGKITTLSNQNDTAAFYYKKALSMNPGNSMYLNNYGTVLFHLGHLEEARQQFELSTKTNPLQSDAFSNLGSVYGTMGQQMASQNHPEEARKYYDLAIVNFKKAIDNTPDYAPGYTMLGITYRNIGDETNAKFYLDRAEQLKTRVK